MVHTGIAQRKSGNTKTAAMASQNVHDVNSASVLMRLRQATSGLRNRPRVPGSAPLVAAGSRYRKNGAKSAARASCAAVMMTAWKQTTVMIMMTRSVVMSPVASVPKALSH